MAVVGRLFIPDVADSRGTIHGRRTTRIERAQTSGRASLLLRFRATRQPGRATSLCGQRSICGGLRHGRCPFVLSSHGESGACHRGTKPFGRPAPRASEQHWYAHRGSPARFLREDHMAFLAALFMRLLVSKTINKPGLALLVALLVCWPGTGRGAGGEASG